MSIYVIGDLHLSFNTQKPMDIFGENWTGHEEKIKRDWLQKVKDEDLVVLPGDFSWETYLENTKKDFEYLNNLPGKKILLKGNHDYWWTTITSMRKFLKENNFENIDFLYNNSYEFEDKILCGTRGWSITDEETNEKLINRELIRLELSLQDGVNKYGTDKVEMMRKYKVKRCFYGHLHGTSIADAVEGNIEGIELKLVSADGLDFELLKIT